ncbi:zinc finger protein 37-like [Ischnura elegans]|uniref:zinc finger protein 37-like n=1 Tax=Ischnura elegans TaxID=197161 RepID=UPI001ED89051|nr:zinc finger protein 37-like [Ischnura elegans]
MESNEKAEVLDEVELLLKKLKDLPDDLKQAALSKIQEQLKPSPAKDDKIVDGSETLLKAEDIVEEEDIIHKEEVAVKNEEGSVCAPKETNVTIKKLLLSDQIVPGSRVVAIQEPILSRKKSRRYGLASSLVEVTLVEDESVDEKRMQEGHSATSDKEARKFRKVARLSDYVINLESLDSDAEQDVDDPSPQEGKKSESEECEDITENSESKSGAVDDKDTTTDDEDSRPPKRRGRPSKQGRHGKLFCKDCNFETNRPSQLEIHRRKHSGFKPYACPECGKAFPHSSGLNVHIKRHRGQRDFPCELCDYRAYTKIDKTRHMTVHTGERNHVCEYCGKAFAKDSTLREHVKSIHERKDKYVCEECGFQTFRANNLRVHIRMVHRGEFDNHVCPVCNAHVKQRSAFLEHMRAHTGERPFQCKLCPSSFACPARLTVHINSVHAPRSFPCDKCSKVFQTKHHLLRHRIIHTNERPFACPFCMYACNTQGNMSKHVRAVHHMPDFSFRKHKLATNLTRKKQNASKKSAEVKIEQEGENSSELESNDDDWVRKGQRVTEEYLKSFSAKVGRKITLEELQAKEEEKKKKLILEQYHARQRRINRILTPEHSYYSKNIPVKLDEPKKKLKSTKAKVSEGEEMETCDSATVEEINTNGAQNHTATIVVGTVEGQALPTTSSSVIHLNTAMGSSVINQVSQPNPSYQTVYLPSGMVMAGGGQLYRLISTDGSEIQLSSTSTEATTQRSNLILETPEEDSAEPTVVVIINTDETAET